MRPLMFELNIMKYAHVCRRWIEKLTYSLIILFNNKMYSYLLLPLYKTVKFSYFVELFNTTIED